MYAPATPRSPRRTGNRTRGHPHPARAGFTVAELLVGLVLLTIGLIGTAGTATVLTYHAAASARAERATNAALSRLAVIRARGCPAGPGTEVDGPLTLTWTVTTTGRSVRADLTVSFRELGTSRALSYSAAFLC